VKIRSRQSVIFRTGIFIATIVCLSIANSLTAAAVGAAGQPSADVGKQVFEKRCSGCHDVNRAKEGPPLGGVVGRKAGSVAGFEYSAALKASGITWDETKLERWLAAPEMLIPDTDMSFQVASPEERVALVMYLKSLK
jgi:cytochrome c